MTGNTSNDELIGAACAGNRSAADQLLAQHRTRLCHMVRARMDDRVTARADPSDVVQETMLEASQRLTEYLDGCPIPFFAWLRQIAAERLNKLHRRHIGAQKRTVNRERHNYLPLNDRSSLALASRLVDGGTSPSGKLQKTEQHKLVKAALAGLRAADREVLVLRHLEQLSTAETAAVLGVSETAAMSRHFRAIRRLQAALGDKLPGPGK